MQLTEEQKATVKEWVVAGLGLSEIQKKLSGELGVTMTYMEVRFLVDDLGVVLKNKEVRPSKAAAIGQVEPAPGPGMSEHEIPDEGELVDDTGTHPGKTLQSTITVEVDRIMKPGSVVSGTVVFSDGVKGSWMFDSYGQLGLSTNVKDYRPSPDDVRAFQKELGSQLKKRGF